MIFTELTVLWLLKIPPEFYKFTGKNIAWKYQNFNAGHIDLVWKTYFGKDKVVENIFSSIVSLQQVATIFHPTKIPRTAVVWPSELSS